jgi:hypothetical protein
MWAVNLMRYHPVAKYPDGRQTRLSGYEADDLYSPQEELAKVGAAGVLRAPVVHQLVGDGGRWDRVAIAKYPTRVAQLDMQRLPEFQERHVHKIAGMEFTIVLAGFRPDDAPPPPPGLAETPMMLVQVVGDRNAPDYAADLEAAPVAVFEIEDTIIGDQRKYAQVRLHMLSVAVGDQLKSRRRADDPGSYVLLTRIERNRLAGALAP